MSTYVVGDIQGCHQELSELLEHITFKQGSDHLIVAGDLINRGPKNLETLDLLQNLPQTHVVLGNHDLHFLAVASGLKKPSRSDTFQDVLSSNRLASYVEWLRHQPLLLHLEEFNAIVVHAGIPNIWKIQDAKNYASEVEAVLQSDQFEDFLESMYGNLPTRFSTELVGMERLRCITNYLTRMRYCQLDGTLDLEEKSQHAPTGFDKWFCHPRNDSLKILFGHWAAIEGQTNLEQFIALDTGCVWGNTLTAIRLEDNQRFSIPAQNRD